MDTWKMGIVHLVVLRRFLSHSLSVGVCFVLSQGVTVNLLCYRKIART